MSKIADSNEIKLKQLAGFWPKNQASGLPGGFWKSNFSYFFLNFFLIIFFSILNMIRNFQILKFCLGRQTQSYWKEAQHRYKKKFVTRSPGFFISPNNSYWFFRNLPEKVGKNHKKRKFSSYKWGQASTVSFQ